MVSFHSGAQASFSTAAEELLRSVKAFPSESHSSSVNKFEVHPSVVIGTKEIIGTPKFTESQVDGTGAETGRFWVCSGQRVGWTGDAFLKMKRLAEKISVAKEIQGLVRHDFILDQIFDWLCQTLEGTRSDSIGQFISDKCEGAISDHEIYVPLCRTYSTKDFSIGDVDFRSITKGLLDGWFPSKALENPEMESRVRQLENQTRATYQGSLAACVKIRAEKEKASELALEKALSATALLRFLSPANWTSKIRSYALPLGMEGGSCWHSFHLVNGIIASLESKVHNEGPSEWVIDGMGAQMIALISPLSDLAQSQKTEFRKTIFDAMLMYSRNSTTTNPSDKLVFVLVALESVLLRDSSEPIQGNLGERMAFLIGDSLESRKEIVSTVKKVYGIRSKFIHHGQGIENLETLDCFLFHAWLTFLKLLENRDQFKTKIELLSKLDEMKLS